MKREMTITFFDFDLTGLIKFGAAVTKNSSFVEDFSSWDRLSRLRLGLPGSGGQDQLWIRSRDKWLGASFY